MQSTKNPDKLQVAFQSTPSFERSPATTAVNLIVAPPGAEAGGGSVMVMPVIVETIVTLAAFDLLWSVAESAVIAIVPFVGTESGAVKIAVNTVGFTPGENTGAKEPQLGALAHTAVHCTPAFAMSLLTVAVTMAVAPTSKDCGGPCVIDTEITGVRS